MATQVYGMNRGDTEFQMVTGVGNPNVSKDVEVSIDLTKGLTKSEVIIKLREITDNLVKGNWPPA